jgi:hypothetical protein
MLSTELKIVAAVLVGVGAAGTSWAGEQETGVAVGARPAAPRPDVTRLPTAAALMYKHIKTPVSNELNWQRIPWLLDLSEAIRQAKAEDRPILLWASGDEPLERC